MLLGLGWDLFAAGASSHGKLLKRFSGCLELGVEVSPCSCGYMYSTG